MQMSCEKLFFAVQEDRNSPLLEDLIERLVQHGVNYAANKYRRHLDRSTVYDWVIDGYMRGMFEGSFIGLRSMVRNRVDRWAREQNQPAKLVGLEACSEMVCQDDMDMFELPELVRDVLSDLTAREQRVVEICILDNLGLEAAGREFGLTRSRVEQIRNKAVFKLRHPSRSKRLRAWYDATYCR